MVTGPIQPSWSANSPNQLISPEGNSVNDGINPELCSLSYASVDDAARVEEGQGQGALLAKVDIKSTYRMVSVHSEDRMFLAIV